MFDYEAGKKDWLAHGLPREGRLADVPLAGDLARDVATCRLEETVATARDRAASAGSEVCVVTTADGVVLGLLDPRALRADDEVPAAEAMRGGPTTFRPSVEAGDLGHYLSERDVSRALVTTSGGRLVGLVLTEDLLRSSGHHHV